MNYRIYNISITVMLIITVFLLIFGTHEQFLTIGLLTTMCILLKIELKVFESD